MLHRHCVKNIKGRDFVVSDLHGCFALLQEAMIDVNFNKEDDRLFSVGDLIDRGPKSIDCLRLIEEPWFYPVIGNHEVFLMESALDGEHPGAWMMMNGGEWVIDEDREEVNKLAQFLRDNVPYAITVEADAGKIGICHAQPPTRDWADAANPTEDNIKTMTWSRAWVENKHEDHVKGVFKTIHGHTPIREPVQCGNALFIDTCAFHTGNLTMVELTMSPSDTQISTQTEKGKRE